MPLEPAHKYHTAKSQNAYSFGNEPINPRADHLHRFTPPGSAEPQERELVDIIMEKKIFSVYQPIVDLTAGKIMGYEALSRGPAGSSLHWPLTLFDLAIKKNMLLPLEQVCREAAIKHFLQPDPGHNLFLNLNAAVIKDPNFTSGATKLILSQQGMLPSQVVFEITERMAIDDYDSFHRSLEHYRRQGYRVAVDDAGAGYSSLQAIAELEPDYIKLDRSIICDIHQSPLKQTLLESMVKLAGVINSQIIAEGVESAEELSFLIQNGVPYAQGYFLARPGFPLPDITPAAKKLIVETTAPKSKYDKKNNPSAGLGDTIGQIVQHAPTFSVNVLVKEVEEAFAAQRVNGVVVLNENQEPAGLLMKDKLYFQLGTKYGVSLYHSRSIQLVMDKSPLIVNADLPLEAVSQMAMNREEYNLYDLIIVVKDGRYFGVVSVMHLLNSITSLRIRCAHNSNPLTGLPGNLIIEDRIKSLVSAGAPFAVFYIDLDNFKAFNDKYGFELGDKLLLLTSQILSRGIAQAGQGSTFLGHIGGDDFVIATHPENIHNMGDAIIRLFDEETRSLYLEEDRERGYIEVENRRGQFERFPLVSISMAVVTNQTRNFTNFLEIGEVLAELKKVAKKRPGSCIVVDRRTDRQILQ